MFGANPFGSAYFGQITVGTEGVPVAVLFYRTRPIGRRAASGQGFIPRTSAGAIDKARAGRVSRQVVGQEFD